MRTRDSVAPVLVPVVAAVLVLAGCSSSSDPVVQPPLFAPTVDVPTFDETLEPAATVMAVVPASATSLGVTDFTQVRLNLGLDDVTSQSSGKDRRHLAQQARKHSPELTPGLLAPVDDRLRHRYGFGQDDVDWEAYWSGPDGNGTAIKLRDDVPADGPTRAAADGVGPLAGTTYYPTTHVFLVGGTTDPTASWRADPSLTALVGQVAAATYVDRACVAFDDAFGAGLESQLAPGPADDLAKLGALTAYSVSLGESLATVHLGEDRPDTFDRARLADHLPETSPDFGLAFGAPVVADPAGGRIGYSLADPKLAARLTLAQHLPFAVCPPS